MPQVDFNSIESERRMTTKTDDTPVTIRQVDLMVRDENSVPVRSTTDDPYPAGMTLEKLKEVIRMSEAYIDGTLKISIASDTRAMQLSAMTAAASTALLVFGLDNLVDPTTTTYSVPSACFSSAVVLIAALFSALSAAKPRNFAIPGTVLKNWGDEEREGDLRLALWGQAMHYSEMATENLEVLARNSKKIKAALKLLAAAPVVGALAAAVTYAAEHRFWL